MRKVKEMVQRIDLAEPWPVQIKPLRDTFPYLGVI